MEAIKERGRMGKNPTELEYVDMISRWDDSEESTNRTVRLLPSVPN